MTGPPSAWRGPCHRHAPRHQRPARPAAWPLGWVLLALGVARLVLP